MVVWKDSYDLDHSRVQYCVGQVNIIYHIKCRNRVGGLVYLICLSFNFFANTRGTGKELLSFDLSVYKY